MIFLLCFKCPINFAPELFTRDFYARKTSCRTFLDYRFSEAAEGHRIGDKLTRWRRLTWSWPLLIKMGEIPKMVYISGQPQVTCLQRVSLPQFSMMLSLLPPFAVFVVLVKVTWLHSSKCNLILHEVLTFRWANFGHISANFFEGFVYFDIWLFLKFFILFRLGES